MNCKAFAIRHWKLALLLARIGLIMLIAMTIGGTSADPIDSPVGPI